MISVRLHTIVWRAIGLRRREISGLFIHTYIVWQCPRLELNSIDPVQGLSVYRSFHEYVFVSLRNNISFCVLKYVIFEKRLLNVLPNI